MVLVGALALLVWPAPRPPPAAQRLAAEQRWETRGFRGYRIVSRMGACTQRGEFRDGQVLSLSRQDCFDSIRTVESLFALIARIEGWGLARPRCAPSGCVCRETRAIRALYDERLGYPRAVRLYKTRSVDWLRLLREPAGYPAALDCASPPVTDLLVVTELEALP